MSTKAGFYNCLVYRAGYKNCNAIDAEGYGLYYDVINCLILKKEYFHKNGQVKGVEELVNISTISN